MPRSRSVLDAEPSMYPILRAWNRDLGSICVNYALKPQTLNCMMITVVVVVVVVMMAMTRLFLSCCSRCACCRNCHLRSHSRTSAARETTQPGRAARVVQI